MLFGRDFDILFVGAEKKRRHTRLNTREKQMSKMMKIIKMLQITHKYGARQQIKIKSSTAIVRITQNHTMNAFYT